MTWISSCGIDLDLSLARQASRYSILVERCKPGGGCTDWALGSAVPDRQQDGGLLTWLLSYLPATSNRKDKHVTLTHEGHVQ